MSRIRLNAGVFIFLSALLPSLPSRHGPRPLAFCPPSFVPSLRLAAVSGGPPQGRPAVVFRSALFPLCAATFRGLSGRDQRLALRAGAPGSAGDATHKGEIGEEPQQWVANGSSQRRQLPRLSGVTDLEEMLDAIEPFVSALDPLAELGKEPPLPWEASLLMNQLARVAARREDQRRGAGRGGLELMARARRNMEVLGAVVAAVMEDLSLKNVAWSLNSAKRVPTNANEALFRAAALRLRAVRLMAETASAAGGSLDGGVAGGEGGETAARETAPRGSTAGEQAKGWGWDGAERVRRAGAQNVALIANAVLDHERGVQGRARSGGKGGKAYEALSGVMQDVVWLAVEEPLDDWANNTQVPQSYTISPEP